MIAAFAAFWALLYLGREELGFKGIVIAIVISLGLMVGSVTIDAPSLFVSAQALLDVALLLIVFGGDVKIR